MADITKIPAHELLADMEASEKDIAVCQKALELGVVTYGNNESVERRIAINRAIIRDINEEIARRGAEMGLCD